MNGENEKWVVPLYVYDEITANDTRQVLLNMGYFVDPVYKMEVSGE